MWSNLIGELRHQAGGGDDGWEDDNNDDYHDGDHDDEYNEQEYNDNDNTLKQTNNDAEDDDEKNDPRPDSGSWAEVVGTAPFTPGKHSSGNSDDNNNNITTNSASSRFMGRLTQFLEHVTSADVRVDDDDDNFDNEEEEYLEGEEAEGSRHLASVAVVEDGWGTDDDDQVMDLVDDPPLAAAPSHGLDKDDQGHGKMPPDPPNVFERHHQPSTEGWIDDTDDLEELDLNVDEDYAIGRPAGTGFTTHEHLSSVDNGVDVVGSICNDTIAASVIDDAPTVMTSNRVPDDDGDGADYPATAVGGSEEKEEALGDEIDIGKENENEKGWDDGDVAIYLEDGHIETPTNTCGSYGGGLTGLQMEQMAMAGEDGTKPTHKTPTMTTTDMMVGHDDTTPTTATTSKPIAVIQQDVQDYMVSAAAATPHLNSPGTTITSPSSMANGVTAPCDNADEIMNNNNVVMEEAHHPTTTNTTALRVDVTPPPSGGRYNYVEQAQRDLQQVMHEIDDMTMGRQSSEEEGDFSHDDEMHHDQAIFEIRRELDQIAANGTVASATTAGATSYIVERNRHHVRDDVEGDDDVRFPSVGVAPHLVLVDYTPAAIRGKALDENGAASGGTGATKTATSSVADPSLVVLAPDDEWVVRDQGYDDDGDDADVDPSDPAFKGGGTAYSDDDVEADDPEEDYGPVVDHTPSIADARIQKLIDFTQEDSTACQATQHVEQDFADDDAMDESCIATVQQQQQQATDLTSALSDDEHDDVTIVPSTATTSVPQDEPLVDCIPSQTGEASRPSSAGNSVVGVVDPSVVVLPSEGETVFDAIPEDDDGNDINQQLDFGPVVDHTPSLPARIPSSSSLAAFASVVDDDIRAHDAMDETCYGESTIGTVGEGWEEEEEEEPTVANDVEVAAIDAVNAELSGTAAVATMPKSGKRTSFALEENFVVDHLPSEMPKDGEEGTERGCIDPSVSAVAPADDATREEGESVYGPMVDQTPPTPDPSAMGVATTLTTSTVNSMLARAPVGLQKEFQRDEEMEESAHGDSTILGTTDGISGDGWDQDESAAMAEADDEAAQDGSIQGGFPPPPPDEEDQVVDHVPAHPEVRRGDASTLVAAEPSEVMSEVDDMMAAEGNFGPVVDLTPLSRPPAAAAEASATGAGGSTVVFAPGSVAVDDLDDVDETVQDGWEQDDPIVEGEPNPQSGNDEPVAPPAGEEPLVDFLPPTNAPQPEETREALSEMTVGGAQSLLPTEEVKEDDFGPVVDQTPIPPSASHPSGMSYASTVTQVTMSEIRELEKADKEEEGTVATSEEMDGSKSKVVVDHLPHLDKLNVDSLAATAARSQLSDDDEEEEEDDSKFGPVVDQLPIPRASTAPSRGGSTVDALATVSEVDSDDEEGNGWDDDGDLDMSLGGASDGTMLRMALRRQQQQHHNNGESDRNVSVRFDSSVNEFSSAATDCGGIVEGAATNSTDTRSVEGINSQVTLKGSMAGGEAASDATMKTSMVDESFADADTPPSTPYRRADSGDMGLIDSIELGPSIALGGNISRAKDGVDDDDGAVRCGACSTNKSVDCPCVRELLNANLGKSDALVGRIHTPEGDTVEIDFNTLLQDEILKRRLLEEELKATRSIIGANSLTDVLRAVSEVEGAAGDTAVRANDNFEIENGRLSEELAASRADVVRLEAAVNDASVRESTLEAQVRQLQNELDGSHLRTRSECNLHVKGGRSDTTWITEPDASEQDSALQRECATLREENAKLNDQLASLVESSNMVLEERNESAASESWLRIQVRHLQDELRGYSASSSTAPSQANTGAKDEMVQIREELVAKAGECETLSATVGQLRQQLDDGKEAHKVLLESSEQTETETMLRQSMMEAQSESDARARECQLEVTNLLASNDLLLEQLTGLKEQHKETMQQHSKLLEEKTGEIIGLENSVYHLKTEKEELLAKVEGQLPLLMQAETLSKEMQRIAGERDALRESLVSLQAQVQGHDENTSELIHLRAVAASVEADSKNLVERISCLEEEKVSLQTACEAMKASLEANKLDSIKAEARAARAADERLSLQQSLKEREQVVVALRETIGELETARDELKTNRDGENDALRVEVRNLRETLATSEQRGQDVDDSLASLQRDKDGIALELEESKAVCQSLRAASEAAKFSAVKTEARSREALKALKADLAQATREKQELSGSLATSEANLIRLQGEIEELKVGREALREDNGKEMTSLAARVNELTSSLASAKAECSSLARDIDVIKRDRDSFSVQLKQSQALCQSLKSGAAAASLAAVKDEAKAAKSLETIKSLKIDLFKSTKEVQRLQTAVEEKESVILSMQAKVSELEKKGQTNAEMERVVETLSSTNGKLQDLERKYTSLIKDRDAKVRELQDSQQNCRSLESAVRASESAASREQERASSSGILVESLRAELERHAEDRHRIETELDLASTRVIELEAHSRAVEAQKEKVEAHVADQQRELSILASARDGVVSARDELAQRCRELEARLNIERRDQQRVTEDLSERYKLDVSQWQAECERLRAELREKENISGQLEQERESARREAEEERKQLTEENEEMLVQFGLMKQQLDLSEEQVRSLQSEISYVGDARDAADEDFRAELEHASQLQSQLEGVVQEHQELRRRYEELETECREKQEGMSQEQAMVQGLREQMQGLERACLEKDTAMSSMSEELRSARDDACAAKIVETELRKALHEAEQRASDIAEKIDLNTHAVDDSWSQEKDNLISTIRKLETKVAEVTKECTARNDRLVWLESELTKAKTKAKVMLEEMQQRAENLQHSCDRQLFEKNDLKDQLEYAATDNTKNLERLRQTERRLADSSARVRELEAERGAFNDQLRAVEDEIASTKESCALKDKECTYQKEQLDSTTSALRSTHETLSKREEEIERLRTDLSEVYAKQQAALSPKSWGTSSTSLGNEHTMEGLRTRLIGLAFSLERSENMRAEALERLVKERQGNADSLRRLSESVKRFYSTMSLGDS